MKKRSRWALGVIGLVAANSAGPRTDPSMSTPNASGPMETAQINR